MNAPTPSKPIQIDIVSDVVCPWCIVGYRQLEKAIEATGLRVQLRWHPFELNPNMPPEGQGLREHIVEKYGVTATQSQQARDDLTELGNGLGFDFDFNDESRMVNTFLAHQLVEWAATLDRQSEMMLTLFHAYFTHGLDVSNRSTLVDIAADIGLDRDKASAMLANGDLAPTVRTLQKFWTDQGIQGVPAVVFSGKYLLSGAQGVDTYIAALKHAAQES
jgi:predicted DsbA family dithiol-disulfide isomerase